MRPLISLWGKTLTIAGDKPGAAQVLKLTHNTLFAVSLAATSEAFGMGAKGGLDPEVMVGAINAGSGRNGATETVIPTAGTGPLLRLRGGAAHPDEGHRPGDRPGRGTRGADVGPPGGPSGQQPNQADAMRRPVTLRMPASLKLCQDFRIQRDRILDACLSPVTARHASYPVRYQIGGDRWEHACGKRRGEHLRMPLINRFGHFLNSVAALDLAGRVAPSDQPQMRGVHDSPFKHVTFAGAAGDDISTLICHIEQTAGFTMPKTR